jgi:hypothetical protein
MKHSHVIRILHVSFIQGNVEVVAFAYTFTYVVIL